MKYLIKVKILNEGNNLLNEFYIYLKYKERELESRRGLVGFAKPELSNNKLKFMAYAGEEDYRVIVTIHNTELKTIKEIEMEYDDPNVMNFDDGSAFNILMNWFTKLFNCECIYIKIYKGEDKMEKHEINYFLTHFDELKDPETGLLRFHKAGDKTFLHYVMRANDRMINVCSIWGYGGYDDCYFPADEFFNILETDIYHEKEYEIYNGGHK